MRLVDLIGWIERRSPRLGARIKRWFVERAVPFNRTIGVRLDDVDPDTGEVVLRLPHRRGNLNVGGTVHGGVIIALAETAHGIAILWSFPPDRHRMASRELSAEFVALARGDLEVRFTLPEPVRSRIDRDLSEGGRADVELEAEVVDPRADEVVARVRADYRVWRREP